MKLFLIFQFQALIYGVAAYHHLKCLMGPGRECALVPRNGDLVEKIEDVEIKDNCSCSFHSKNISYVILDNLSSEYLPKVFEKFKKLTESLVLVRNCGKIELTPKTFKKSSVMNFEAIGNIYHRIEAKLISEAKKLKSIKLRRNRIREISKFAFNDCLKLSHIDLAENEISQLKTESFNCATLVSLNLENNRISQILEDSFKGASNMEILNLNGNDILEIVAFHGLQNLKKLFMNHNQLSELRSWMIQDLGDLEEIYLDNNRIKVLHGNSFPANNSLSVVSLNRNNLEAIARNAFKSEFF
jgi:Leucine-rich repeat (LRR) protein